jgi:hypothetical protein
MKKQVNNKIPKIALSNVKAFLNLLFYNSIDSENRIVSSAAQMFAQAHSAGRISVEEGEE